MKSSFKRVFALILAIVGIISVFAIPASASYVLPSIYYKTHCQNVGWTGNSYNGAMSGTTGQSLRVEAIQIRTSGMSGGVTYRTHCQNIGWTSWSSNGSTSGTTGQSLRVEAIEIKLTGTLSQNYDVMYRTHCQNIGWTDWSKNGATSGTTGQSLRVEAIQIKLVAKSGTNTTSTTESTSTWDSPMRGNVVTTQAFGKSGHLGIDIKSTSDINVYAAASGKVVAVGLNGTGTDASVTSNPRGNGYYVVIEHSLNGKKIYSTYGHLAAGKTRVSVNQTVQKGAVIGVCGNTGNSTGAHLHFAITNAFRAGSYYGYTASRSTFSANNMYESRSGISFYNPMYVINNDRLP